MKQNGAQPQLFILPGEPKQGGKIGLDDHLRATRKSARNGHGKLLELTKTAEHPLLAQDRNDVGNALRYIEHTDGNVKYIYALGYWVQYDGTRWAIDDTEEQDLGRAAAHKMLRAYAKQAAAAADKEHGQFAFSCLNTPRVNHLLREAQTYATLAIAELDRDPLLLNFRNGTLDARTMKLRPHRREDYITALIPHEYDPQARCPKFEQFVQQTFAGNRQVIEFVQRALGYSLTGDTSEKCLFLAYGPTNTAKTTLLTTVRTLLGQYAGQMKVASLMMRAGRPLDSNAEADLADLRGKRFVMTSETGEGQRIREELIKELVQGQGTYRAVRKYQNPFNFDETWKIWMDSNHRPVIHGTDDAIWERLVVIPFEHTIPKAKQNKNLSRDLVKQEAQGILAWLVRGLAAWMRGGLRSPVIITALREKWRKDADHLGLWLRDKCVLEDTAKTKGSVLYENYKAWRKDNGLWEESNVVFARKMVERGFHKETDSHSKGSFWVGVDLDRPNPTPPSKTPGGT